MLNHETLETEENLEKTHAFADGFYAGLQLALTEFEKYHDMILAVCRFPQKGREARDQVLLQLWSRCYSWLLSLEQLNHTKHYQATAAACRAELEIAVDVALLHKGDADGYAMKMRFFMESEKLKMCEQLIRFFQERGLDIPDEHQALLRFFNQEKNRIERNRALLWPARKGSHPSRWTGNDLSVDVKEVDRLYGTQIEDELGISLERFYRTEYRRMNWHIHSGLASTWMLPAESFDITAGFLIKWSVDLAFLTAKLVLLDLGLTSALPGLRDRWEKLQFERDKIFIEKNQSD